MDTSRTPTAEPTATDPGRSLMRRLFPTGLDGTRATILLIIARAMVVLAVVVIVGAALGMDLYPRDGAARWAVLVVVFVVGGTAACYFAAGRPVLLSDVAQRRRIAEQQAVFVMAAQQHEFAASLQDAFEMADSEADAVALVARAIPLVYPGPAELLLADSSRAHLNRVAVPAAGAAGCSVRVPGECPAVRRGHSITFDSSDSLGACPRLAERGPGLAARCIPVMILGAPMGVLHLVAPADTTRVAGKADRLESIAVVAGARIGALRATASTQLAAATDPLTGLLNRRSLTDRLQQLALAGTPYAVAFADLDSFKALNDTFGHATGDHALRLFARTLTTTLREDEVVSRYGGEEFLVVLPGCGVDQAAPVVHRLRDRLRAATAEAGAASPAFTASFGLADSTYADDPLDVVACADEALLQAKHDGKDRLVIADRPGLRVVPPPERARAG